MLRDNKNKKLLMAIVFIVWCLAFVGPARASGQQYMLTAGDGNDNDNFGISVSISGIYAIVGANLHDGGKGDRSGSAYIYKWNGEKWNQQKILTASDGNVKDYFGRSVSISGDYVIVGAWGTDDNGEDSGSAYIFYRNQGGNNNWGQWKKLTAADAEAEDLFGFSVSISGDYAIVGALRDGDNGEDFGSAYIFYRNEDGDNNWGQQAKLTASDGNDRDCFGDCVSISGDYAIVGAPWDSDEGKGCGSAYIFYRNEGGTNKWDQQDKLTDPEPNVEDHFGSSVSNSGDYAIVGVPGDDSYGGEEILGSGSAYIFKRDGTSWSWQKKLTASDAECNYGKCKWGDHFGSSVSISGDYAIVGAVYGDDGDKRFAGSAYIFRWDGASWIEQQPKLTASDSKDGDHFGVSVSISPPYAIVGADDDDNKKGTEAGSAYVFSWPWYFIHITDTHVGADGAKGKFEDMVEFINGLDPPPFFVLITGDLIEGYTAGTDNSVQYAQFNSVAYGLAMPYYTCPGNHDYRDLGGQGIQDYRDFIEEDLNYVESYNGIEVISMDSGKDEDSVEITLTGVDMLPEANGLTTGQYNWLNNALSENPELSKIFFMHHPVVLCEKEYNYKDECDCKPSLASDEGCGNGCICHHRKDVWDLLHDHAVKVVLTGHTHKPYQYKADNFDKPNAILIPKNGVSCNAYSDYLPLYIITASVVDNKSYRRIEVDNGEIRVFPNIALEETGSLSADWIRTSGGPNCLPAGRLHVYDSNSNHVGVNDIGGIDFQIEGAVYQTNIHPIYDANLGCYPIHGEEISVVLGAESYRYKLKGSEESTLQLRGKFIMEDGSRIVVSYPDINAFPDSNGTLNVDGYSVNYTLYWDDDGDGTVDRNIPPAEIICEGQASVPFPADGAEDVARNVVLSWLPAFCANSHDVYFGRSREEVEDANTANTSLYPGVFRGNQPDVNDPNYPVPEDLEVGKSYFWRIDEVNGVNPWKGPVWSFTTTPYVVIDDFDSYVDTGTLNDTWHDWVTASPGTGQYNAEVIYETSIVHDGNSMEYRYYNDVGGGGPKERFSEAWAYASALGAGTDWTVGGVKALVLYFYGDPCNAPDPVYDRMWVVLSDDTNEGMVKYDGDMNDIKKEEWQEWNINLQDPCLSAVDTNNVTKVYIGFGVRAAQTVDGTDGTVYFDDITLHPPRCVPEYAIVDFTGDCIADLADLDIMARDWLETDYEVMPEAPSSTGLLVEYLFDTDYSDTSSNGYHGEPCGSPVVSGGVLTLDGNSFVDIPFDGDNPFDGSSSFTIAMKFRTENPGILISSSKEDPCDTLTWDHSMSLYIAEWGEVVYDNFWVGAAAVGGEPLDGEWHTVVTTYDAGTHVRVTYLDYEQGQEVEFNPDIPNIELDTVRIGGSLNFEFPYEETADINFIGDINNVHIYDYPLAHGNVLWLAGEPNLTYFSLTSPANLVPKVGDEGVYNPANVDIINFKDYARLANNWLMEFLWP